MSILSGPSGSSPPPAGAVAARFSRAARIAIAGLLVPALALQAASALEWPAAGMAREALAWLPVLAFCLSGHVAGAALERGTRGKALTAAGFTAAGLLVAPAFGSLQGLTGRESPVVVTAVVTGAFALAFGAAAGAGALALGLSRRLAAGTVLLGLLAGVAGGLLALLPFISATLGVKGTFGYLDMALAVASVLGCLIVPYRGVGAALERGDAARLGPPSAQR